MKRTCVITGAAGFIGSHLSQAMLRAGWRVVGIDNFDPFYSRAVKERNLDAIGHDDFTFHEIDICDRERLIECIGIEAPHRLVHIAALAGVRPSMLSPERFVRVNLDGLINA
ncbi:MAG: GDP-mannose 4,6-dehydratase, partial [Phycisphaerales bacterium]|nr:GDP-mannose 4,6-dehydratase [Phycisphaerales bacterium]